MAQINEQFIQVKTKANFESRLSAGEIKDTSIAFIEDTNEIWAKGHYYPCPYSATEITNLLNNKVDKESGKSLVADELITKLSGLNDQASITAAINAVKTAVDAYTVNGKTISTNPTINASEVPITDTLGYFDSSNVEDALQETKQPLDTHLQNNTPGLKHIPSGGAAN